MNDSNKESTIDIPNTLPVLVLEKFVLFQRLSIQS